MRRRIHKSQVVGGAVVVVFGAAGIVAFAALKDFHGGSCDWSTRDEQRLASVPFSEFIGAPVDPPTARCNISTPDWLFAEVAVPNGASLPLGWRTRSTVGEWTMVDTGLPDVACYVSALEEWRDVQVNVSPDAAWASLSKAGGRPCGQA